MITLYLGFLFLMGIMAVMGIGLILVYVAGTLWQRYNRTHPEEVERA